MFSLSSEVVVAQLRMGEGALGLLGAVVVPSEEGEQGRDEEDEASCSSHLACVARGLLQRRRQVCVGRFRGQHRKVCSKPEP